MFDDLVAQNFDDDPCVVVHACGVQETTLGREGSTHHRASVRTTDAACNGARGLVFYYLFTIKNYFKKCSILQTY